MRRSGVARLGSLAVLLGICDRRLVLGPDIAAIDAKRAVGVDADEDAGAGDLGRIVDDRPIVEGGERRLDLAEPLVDLVRQFVGVLILRLELGVFGLQRVDRRLLLGREVGRRAVEFAQAVGMAVGKVDGDLDPLPALGGDRLGLGLQLLGDQPVEQRDILQPAAIVVLEEVAHDDAAGRLIGVEADEQRPLVGGAHGASRSACGGSDRAPCCRSAGVASQTCSWRAWSVVTVKAMSWSSDMPSSA